MKSIYIIGALKNPDIPEFANELEAQGFEAFCDWHAAGESADDSWRDYSKLRKRSYREALRSYSAQHIFAFDKYHLDRCDLAVMLTPAGRSGHIELGYVIGRGKPGYILFDVTPERYDVMVNFATDVFFSKEELFKTLKAL